MSIFHIAIDGVVASGKGTAAKILSSHLGIPCLDTGAIYRAFAVAEMNQTKNPNVTAKIIDNITHVYLNGKDITNKIRSNEIIPALKKVATMPEIRQQCTRIAQDIALKQSIICEGRDICSVVLPNAKYKFFFTARPKTRAIRRHKELISKGQNIKFRQVLKETKARDKNDFTKGGLVKTPDAIVIDSTKLTACQAVELMLKYISR